MNTQHMTYVTNLCAALRSIGESLVSMDDERRRDPERFMAELLDHRETYDRRVTDLVQKLKAGAAAGCAAANVDAVLANLRLRWEDGEYSDQVDLAGLGAMVLACAAMRAR